MYGFQIFFTAILCLLLLVALSFEIHKKRTKANLAFAFSMISASLACFFGLLGFLAADNYIQLDFLIFWEIGFIFLIITPIGFIFSAGNIILPVFKYRED